MVATIGSSWMTSAGWMICLLASSLLWCCCLLPQGVSAYDPSCNFENILDKCGDIVMSTIDIHVYVPKQLRENTVGVIEPIRAFAERLENSPSSNNHNKDIQLAYSFIHYICFDDAIAALAERPVYDCLISVCPRAENNIPSQCEGLHTGNRE
jgi:hypothetical protein